LSLYSRQAFATFVFNQWRKEVFMFLDQEAQDAVFARLRGQEEEVHHSPEPEPSAPSMDEIDVKQEDDTSSEVESESNSNDDESDEGHSIPYNRFKSVIEARNKFKTEKGELERQLAELQAKLENNKTPSRAVEADDESDWFDSIFNEDEVAEPEQDRYSSLERRIQSFEEERGRHQLNAELEVALIQYPDVPEQVLLQAVIKDPSTDMLDVAEQWSTWMTSVKEETIAKYIKEQKTNAPATPRRPSPTSGTRQVTQAKPRTLADARQLALEAWKNTL